MHEPRISCTVSTALLVFMFGSALASPSFSDEVMSLPGLNQSLCFKHYSGYLSVGEGKELFHWFVESEPPVSPGQEYPIVLWLNGGPGCSSLAGMLTENGPFVVGANQEISLNPYSWNKVANMLYLEQPAGVGFSVPEEATNDTITADDSLHALLEFFRLHPHLQGRPFYITGESYAGHYVPNLAKAILDYNSREDAPTINLQGFAVGNAYTDWAHDFNANLPYGYYHALLSPEAWIEINQACGNFTAACFWPNPNVECNAACGMAIDAPVTKIEASLDIYDIYADECLPVGKKAPAQIRAMLRARAAAGKLHGKRSPLRGQQRVQGTDISPVFDTCADLYVDAFLNNPAVQRAIHVKEGSKWQQCGLDGLYDFNFASMVPNYKAWTAEKKLRLLVYSGDADYIVNVLGTESWVTSLGLDVKVPWMPWKGSDGQTAGYVTEYDGLSLVTVKGAGHMVPKDRPGHALDMLTSFLQGAPFDKVSLSAERRPELCKLKSSQAASR
ncbi:hypothetical protein CYMTET_12391 [Cymbomonas tetramitiformis]|uniref:Carboxypeptidase n=1 Tax=Cymbomonas tetramitiformis TaxID=36881 RepID=A0AAE0GKP7_9CHLO|nr:hypothetical protein CYMTET_12391 [Cymbomonas tetramitiformis]